MVIRMDAGILRAKIIYSLLEQGFHINGGQISPPLNPSKETLRGLHRQAVIHQQERSRKGLVRYETKLLKRLANGTEVLPERIYPRLVEVNPDSEDELLFRYARLHWSIPVSPGYGRRLRFLVIDEQNDKLIGIFGLGDPVFSLSARDDWIGWDKETRRNQRHHLMDAFVLGAVPPYSYLLCGKLIAMLVASNEVRNAFRRKYAEKRSLIMERNLDGQLALITTTSALGRSSLYNRLKYGDRLLYQSTGYTRGSGGFHFSNGLYGPISEYVRKNCEPTAKQKQWGTGWRNKREVIRKCLSSLELSSEWIYHGVKREAFVVPLASNSKRFLCGGEPCPLFYDQPVEQLFQFFRERWLLPRSYRDKRYKNWYSNEWLLWDRDGNA